VRDRLLVRDPLVGRALHGDPTGVSERSLQRRFAQAIGLAPSTIRQIDRARRAMDLLLQGVPIADTVDAAGYYDQPHLSRALKRWLGQTPAQIASRGRTG
jgi:AraC-like DNA-binding protein